MKLEFGSLKSKVARRVFLLFITCALFPVVVLTIVGSRPLIKQLNAECRRGLHRDAKSVGMEILGRLGTVESQLRLAAAGLERGALTFGPAGAPADWGNLTPQLRGLTLTIDGVAHPVFGVVGEPATRDTDALRHLLGGALLLSTGTGSEGRPGIFLSVALAGEPAGDRTLVGEIDGDFLWGLRDGGTLPAETEVLVLDGDRRVLFRSGRAAPEPASAIVAASGGVGELRWNHEGREYLGFSWGLFLAGKYGAPSWSVVVGMPQGEVLAPLSQVAKLLPLVALLCLTIVSLASFVQIRRVLVPLESLKRGSERIARKDFETRVQIDSQDEFRDLANSFNLMAADLGRQFRTLTTLAEIDRAILSTVDESRIVRTVLLRTPEHFSSDSVAVMVVDAKADDLARTYFRSPDGSGTETSARVTLGPADRRRLAQARDGVLMLSRNEIPGWLAPLADGAIAHCVVLPFHARQQLAGCVALGYRHPPRFGREELDDAKRLTNQAAVALSNARLIAEREAGNWETLRALARAVDANSPWTAGHSDRVTAMALKLGQRLGLSEDEMLVLHRGGLLHDIGKIGVHSSILDKPDTLTPAETEQMRRHPVIGAQILEPISAYAREIDIVKYHHERPDGSGYPEGLVGEAIPYLARVLAVADVFDALTSDRPYRQPWSIERVVDYIRDASGAQFDSTVVAAFLALRQQEEGVVLCASSTVR